jgi:hypothetical protein
MYSRVRQNVPMGDVWRLKIDARTSSAVTPVKIVRAHPIAVAVWASLEPVSAQ